MGQWRQMTQHLGDDVEILTESVEHVYEPAAVQVTQALYETEMHFWSPDLGGLCDTERRAIVVLVR